MEILRFHNTDDQYIILFVSPIGLYQKPKVTFHFLGMGHPGLGYPMSIGHSSVPPSIISGATTVRRARSVAEISHHGLAYSQPPTPGTKKIKFI
jgi:hypothetical protein